jgi:hypothetical protein
MTQDVHIFVVVYKRLHVLPHLLRDLARRQTAAPRVRVHVWNNNPQARHRVRLITDCF